MFLLTNVFVIELPGNDAKLNTGLNELRVKLVHLFIALFFVVVLHVVA